MVIQTKNYLRSASRVLTNKLALRFGAKGLLTFPITNRLLANSFAFGFWHLAMSNAMGRIANINTLWAVHELACFIGAHRTAIRSFAFNVANSSFGL